MSDLPAVHRLHFSDVKNAITEHIRNVVVFTCSCQNNFSCLSKTVNYRFYSTFFLLLEIKNALWFIYLFKHSQALFQNAAWDVFFSRLHFYLNFLMIMLAFTILYEHGFNWCQTFFEWKLTMYVEPCFIMKYFLTFWFCFVKNFWLCINVHYGSLGWHCFSCE